MVVWRRTLWGRSKISLGAREAEQNTIAASDAVHRNCVV